MLGAILGFVVALLWSRSQAHFLGPHALRGETRSLLVFSHAMLGAVAGGFIVACIAALRRYLKARRDEKAPSEDEPPEAS